VMDQEEEVHAKFHLGIMFSLDCSGCITAYQ
jgi:hypothetical protein